MLLINLTTIYQGNIPILKHSQLHAEALSRSYLKYVLAREIDTKVIRLVRDLTNQNCTIVRNPRTRHITCKRPTNIIQGRPPPLHSYQHSYPAKEHTHQPQPQPQINPPSSLQLRIPPKDSACAPTQRSHPTHYPHASTP